MEYGKPTKLYESSDLLKGYRRDDPMAFAASWDFQTFCGYVADGSTTPKSLDIRRAQADHDAHIAEALKNLLDTNPKPLTANVPHESLMALGGDVSRSLTDYRHSFLSRSCHHEPPEERLERLNISVRVAIAIGGLVNRFADGVTLTLHPLAVPLTSGWSVGNDTGLNCLLDGFGADLSVRQASVGRRSAFRCGDLDIQFTFASDKSGEGVRLKLAREKSLKKSR